MSCIKNPRVSSAIKWETTGWGDLKEKRAIAFKHKVIEEKWNLEGETYGDAEPNG